MAIFADVYTDGDKSPTLFSSGVTREFGQNCIVLTESGNVFSSIMPLKCDPVEAGLKLFGRIVAGECE